MALIHRKEYKDRIIEKAKEGMNLTNIAALYKLNRLDVKIVLQENGLYIPRKKLNKNKTELQEKAVKMYLDGKSLREIEEVLDFPRKDVSALLKKRNISMRKAGDYNQKYTVNEYFFSNYTPESCYVAGFIAGDGCVFSHGVADKSTNYITIGLQKSDTIHLETIKNLLNYNGVLYYSDNSTVLTINSKQLCDDLLKNFNITERKTYNYIPPCGIPQDMMKHFILGLIDADGSIVGCLRSNKGAQHTRGEYIYQIGFTGTYETCEFILKYFRSSVKIHTRHKDRDNNNHTIILQGNRQVLRLCNSIYDDINKNFCLQRKYNVYIKLKEEYGRLYWKQCGL